MAFSLILHSLQTNRMIAFSLVYPMYVEGITMSSYTFLEEGKLGRVLFKPHLLFFSFLFSEMVGL